LVGRRFPRGALTAYRAFTKDKPFYPVDALWFLLEKQKAPHGEYVKECAANAVMPVSLPDRRALLNYLSGATDSSPSIDMTGAPFVQGELVRPFCFSFVLSHNLDRTRGTQAIAGRQGLLLLFPGGGRIGKHSRPTWFTPCSYSIHTTFIGACVCGAGHCRV